MILNEVKPNTESYGIKDEKFFSIADQGMIFGILRSKMYSNPILAVCREITCNARDAHREVGKFQEPIIIHLPSGLEPEYRVKDFGPGISPDRIENIFIKYAASTKRGDNIQGGAYGLGSKSPFAVSDTFVVVTVHNGIKYHYICFIDETNVGKLATLSKVPTTEPNGTEIKIPVKPIDFNFFRQWTEQACRHWEVKPKIVGAPIQWTVFNRIIEGPRWAIATTSDYQRNAKLVIDGIEYPLELDALRKYADPKLIDSAQGTFIMYFGVGELSLSASREQIFLDKATQDKIRDRLTEIYNEIKKRVEDKIQAFPNLWDANVYYRKELTAAFNSLNFLGKLAWKGHTLHHGYMEVKCNIYTFQRGKYSRKHGTDPNKISRSGRGQSLTFGESTKLYLNDLPIKEPTPRHVKKAFDDDLTLKHITVVCPNDKQSIDELNKDLHLDEMAPLKLSAITKASGRAYTPPAQRLLIFKFDVVSNAFRQVSYDSMEEDTNHKVLCLLNRRSFPDIREPLLANKQTLGFHSLRALLEHNPKYSFYGVDKDTSQTRLEEEFSDFDDLEVFIDEKVLNNKINYVEIKFAHDHRYSVDEKMLKHYADLEHLVKSRKSDFLTRLELHKKIKGLADNDTGLLDIYESVKGVITEKSLEAFVKDNPEWDIEKINEAYEKKYPLLGAINTYNYSQIVEHVAHYVNMVDRI